MDSSRKILQILFIQVLASQLLIANGISGQDLSDVEISIKIENATIEQVILNIEKNTDFKFGYNKRTVNNQRRITLKKRNATLKDVLLELSEKAGVKFKRIDNHILISPLKNKDKEKQQPIIEVQGRTLSGKVVDVEGNPLVGATVMLKGTTMGALTDLEGNFSLAVPEEDAVIVISYVGFETQEIAVQDKSEVSIVLKESAETLENVVVVGYGTVKQEDLTTSVSKISLDNKSKSRPANLESMVQGRFAGVTIQSGGGDPLASSSISIRGRGSRGGDGVLYIVDGVPNAPFNIEDVKNISVLKDAASAAIYGAYAGSGGVVIITTKKAREGEINVSLNSYVAYSKVGKLPEVVNAAEFEKVTKEAYKEFPTKALPSIFKESYFKNTRTNWLDEVFRTAVSSHHAISLSGGSEKLKAFASVSYDKNQGILLNTHKQQIGTKLNVNFTPAKWIEINETIKYQHANGQGGLNTDSHEGVLIYSVLFPRSSTIYETDEKGNQLFDDFQNPLYQGTIPRWIAKKGVTGFGEIRNPVATLLRLRQDRPSSKIYSTTSLKVMPINNLTLKSDFTVGLHYDENNGFRSKITEPGRPELQSSRYLSNSKYDNWLSESSIGYKTVVGDRHNINALLGTTLFREHGEGYEITAKGFDRDNERYTLIQNANKKKETDYEEYRWDESAVSIYGRIGYSFEDRYFITGSIRQDQTSKLHPDNRSGLFKAISGSWKISSEPFFSNMKNSISLLKLRASWGEIGNKNLVPRYSYNVALKNSDWYTFFGDNLQSKFKGKFQETLVNKSLRWETTEQLGVGIDLELFNSLSITVDYFDKKTKDLVEKLPVPSQSGFKVSPYGNVGSVSNKGWEVGLNYRKQVGDLTINLFGNFNTVTNKVLDLGTLSKDGIAHGNINVNSILPLKSAVGQPWYSFHLIKTDGIFQSQSEIDDYLFTDKEGNKNKIQPNAKPGDLKYIDFNKDGKINDDDRQFVGSYLPKITYAFGANLEYKGIDFAFFFQGISGNKIFNGFRAMGITGRNSGNYMLKDVSKSWNFDKKSGIPRLSFIEDANGNYLNASDFLLEDGDYLRLKNITLGYTLPVSLMSSLGMEKAKFRFYVNAENIMTFTNYSGFDPEVGKNGVDGGRYPTPRTLSIGLNFNY